MKTVKFKELPEKVQTFLYENQHSLGYVYPENDIQLNWLHNISIWDKATDEERLAYAEWRYNFGVRLKDAYDDEEYDLKLRDTIFYLEKDPRSPHDILLTRHEHHTDITIYDSDKNKWAEIVSEPEKEEQPEFKSGDEVEFSDNGVNWVSGFYVLQHNGIHFREENEYKLIGYVYVRKPATDKYTER